ncbi:MAG: dTDP-4-dehydrorhamnose reductase [Sphingobacteriaceae bacterium]
MERKRILITGAGGQLGSELRTLWASEDAYDCIFLGRQELDLLDRSSIASTLRDLNPDYILHTAAYTSVDKAEEEVELADRINHLATKEIARYAGNNNIKLIYISTDYVFSGEQNSPLKEEAPTGPINMYGKTKLLGEISVLKENSQAIVIRTSWVYSVYGKNFVKTMVRLMNEKTEISVVDDQYGAPTYARDLALVLTRIVHSEEWHPGVYHYCNEGRTSWFEFAQAIKESANLSCQIIPVSSEIFPTLAQRPTFSLLDTSKIKKTFGIEIPNWKESLKGMLQQLAT